VAKKRKSQDQRKGILGQLGSPRYWLIISGVIVAAAVCVYAFSQRAQQLRPKATIVGKTNFGQFPPSTEAERELAKMLTGKDEHVDLALANWLIVADIPQFADMGRDKYFAQLDALTEQVRQEMARRQEIAKSKGKNPNDPETRCGIFCGSVVKLGFDYAEEFRQHDLTPQQNTALHGDGNKVFLAGLLRTRRGSCISMPLIYLVIGQRLGMPVHLVAIGQHYFVRWQEPGYRLNIETTIVDRVAVTESDSVYLEDEGLTKDQLRGSDLRNLSNQEVLGQLLFTRSAYWVMSGERSKSRSWVDLSRAFHLAPDDTAIQKTYQAIFTQYGITPGDTLATLQEKERNSVRPLPTQALPSQAMVRLQQPPPSTMLQSQPSSPAVPAKVKQQQFQQVPGTVIPR